MKIYTNKELSFSSKYKLGWTKEALMSFYALTEQEYIKVIDSLQRIEAEGNNKGNGGDKCNQQGAACSNGAERGS